jgi:hypothetical protein
MLRPRLNSLRDKTTPPSISQRTSTSHEIDFRRRQDLASFRRQEVWPPENSADLPSFVSHKTNSAQEHFTSSTTFWRFNFDYNLHQPRVSIFKAFSFSKWLIHLLWTSKGFSELQLGFLSFTSTPIHCSDEAKAVDIEHTHHMATFNMDFHC